MSLCAGDPNFYDSVYKLNAEDVTALSGTPNSATNLRWIENSVTVNVSDGKLTISNATGADNNKICFIEISAS